jgi:predicted dehydrogenase
VKRLSIGLIGCGRVATHAHIPSLERLRDVRIVALAEQDEERRIAASSRVPGARTFQDPHDLLDMEEVEAVVVCLPNELHAQTALAAIARGKHVYLEKPIATSIEDAERVLVARERAGVVGMMGFNQRFHRLYRALREHLTRRAYGDWLAARTVLTAPETEIPEWKRARRRGGGALLDQASHHFDLIRFLFDQEITEVSARLYSQRSEDDTAVVNLRLSDGTPVQSLLSIHTVDDDRVEVYAERARVSVDRYRSHDLDVLEAGRSSRLMRIVREWKQVPWRIERRRAPARDPTFGYALARFVAAVREGSPASPGFEDGVRSLSAVLAAEESARSGRVVASSRSERP